LTQLSSWERVLLLSRFALEKKACDLVILDLRALSSIADYFILCTGRSDRQVQSIAQSVEENVGRQGIRPLSVEGLARGHWVLMDYDDVILHIFYQPVRQFYDLERLWFRAPRAELPEAYSRLVREFNTASG
jgi:ribosome-associated protein